MAALQLILGARLAEGIRRNRIFRDRNYPLEIYNDEEMYERYRFTRRGVMRLIDLLAADLDRPTRRSQAIDGRLQICIALRFYATGKLDIFYFFFFGFHLRTGHTKFLRDPPWETPGTPEQGGAGGDRPSCLFPRGAGGESALFFKLVYKVYHTKNYKNFEIFEANSPNFLSK